MDNGKTRVHIRIGILVRNPHVKWRSETDWTILVIINPLLLLHFYKAKFTKIKGQTLKKVKRDNGRAQPTVTEFKFESTRG